MLHVGEKGCKNDKLCDVSIQNREMTGAKHEMAGVMQRIGCTVGPLEAKSAPCSSESEIFEGAMERQTSEPQEQRSEKNDAVDQCGSCFVCLEVQNVLY